MSSHLKQGILFALVLAVTAPLAACGYSGEDYCDDACECEGCSDLELEECIDEVHDALRRAENEGCEDQADEYVACVGDEGYCRADGRYDADGCGFEAEALSRCIN